MAFRTKPDMTAIWASLGDNTKPVDSYITNGWEAVKPPRQYFNWLDNRQDSAIAYIYQAGIVQWDALTDYEGGAGNTSYVQGSDGLVYKAVADSGPNIGGTGTKDPVVQPGNAAFWTLAFASQADIDLVEADVATLETQMGDGSGVTNPAAWRSELSVYSETEADSAITAAVNAIPAITADGFVDTSAAPTISLVFARGISSVTRTGVGVYVVTLSDTYTTSGGKPWVVPQITVLNADIQAFFTKITSISTTGFTINTEDSASNLDDPDGGFFITVTGVKA